MNPTNLLIINFGISAYITACTVAHEAIIGGDVIFQQYLPYIVSLLEVDYGHICGGAIIAEQFVLSAAHCFIYFNNKFKHKRVYALIGTSDLMKLTLPGINIEVVKIYVPEEYHASDVHTTSDIAVLKLKKAIPLAYYQHLKSVALEKNQREDNSGVKAVFAGWGWNEITVDGEHITGRRTDSILRYAQAFVLSNEQCQLEHPTLIIDERHLCARLQQHNHDVRGVCHGDDGGPLVRNGLVIGVLSKFLNSCRERTNAAIYTRVSHYLRFIRNAKEDRINRYMRAHELKFDP